MQSFRAPLKYSGMPASTPYPSPPPSVAPYSTPTLLTPSAENTATFFPRPIVLAREDRGCWLTAIVGHKPGYHFYYQVTFQGRLAAWTAGVKVNEELVKEATARQFYISSGIVTIEKSEHSRAEATFGDIVGEIRQHGVYIRKISVKHGHNRYQGQVHVPKREIEAAIQRAREEAAAIPSIENPELQYSPPRRTVEFVHAAPSKGKLAEVEVWARDGHSSYQGKASVVELGKEGERGCENKRRYVVLHTLVSDADADAIGQTPIFLAGELYGDSRVGRFEEVEGPE